MKQAQLDQPIQQLAGKQPRKSKKVKHQDSNIIVKFLCNNLNHLVKA